MNFLDIAIGYERKKRIHVNLWNYLDYTYILSAKGKIKELVATTTINDYCFVCWEKGSFVNNLFIDFL